jgi:uncharacterized protein
MDQLKSLQLKFYILVFVLSIPFWLFGSMSTKWLPMNLPVSALMFFCPSLAALILTYREDGVGGIKRLLKRVFDYKRIRQKTWYLPIIFLMPIILLLSYWVMSLMGRPLPETHIPFHSIPILFTMFFVAATCEELGWMGYVFKPMLSRWNALKTSIILGAVWAIWNFIPFIQTNHSMTWVVWQCFTTVLLRILIVWIYSNTGKSVFSAILFHDIANISVTLFPNNGSHYDPAVTGAFLAITVVIVIFLWGSKTLARYRYS